MPARNARQPPNSVMSAPVAAPPRGAGEAHGRGSVGKGHRRQRHRLRSAARKVPRPAREMRYSSPEATVPLRPRTPAQTGLGWLGVQSHHEVVVRGGDGPLESRSQRLQLVVQRLSLQVCAEQPPVARPRRGATTAVSAATIRAATSSATWSPNAGVTVITPNDSPGSPGAGTATDARSSGCRSW